MRILATLGTVMLVSITVSAQQNGALPDDQVPLSYAQTASPGPVNGKSKAAGGVLGLQGSGGMLGVDSLPTWASYFYVPGLDSNGYTQFTWPYSMVGGSPLPVQANGEDNAARDKTTWVGAPIVPINLDLRDAAGNPRVVNGHPLFFDAAQYVNPVLKSPVFSSSQYSSSTQSTQLGDAIQRAEFGSADDNWHTMLRARVAPARTIVLRQSAAGQPPRYRFARYADGTPAYVLLDYDVFVSLMFPSTSTDTTTVMGAAENGHVITTADLSTFLFNNTYLSGSFGCCVLGFHTYDVEPGDASNGFRERRYVMNYSSWISPGIFGGGFTDITALSHEMAETFNDPFGSNVTPWWLAPNGNCQNDLETGDVIEGLPNGTVAITMNGFTYHPQNEALLQWFASESPSSAIGHAYSYPDTTVLTAPNIPMKPGCQP